MNNSGIRPSQDGNANATNTTDISTTSASTGRSSRSVNTATSSCAGSRESSTSSSRTSSSNSNSSSSSSSSSNSGNANATTTSNSTNSTRASADSDNKSANNSTTAPIITLHKDEEPSAEFHAGNLDQPDENYIEEEEEDATQFEDARSSNERGWFSSQETSFSRGGTNYREFATPAAPSGEASVEVAGATGDAFPPCGLLPPVLLIPPSTADGDSTAADAAAASTTPQPSSTSTPSPPRAPPVAGDFAAVLTTARVTSPPLQQQLPQPPPRVRTVAPSGVYGGPGTAYPTVLLKRRLAAFPVVVPDGVDPARAPGADPAELLAAWEEAEAQAACGACRRTTGDRFLGYPACDCSHLHARCALVCALLAAPNEPNCPGCQRRLRLHRAGRVKPGGRVGGGGPLSEAWFSVPMATGLSTAAALLAVSVALLLALIEPDNRGLLAATNQPLLAGLFCLLGLALLACFLIGWLLDRCTAAAWEVHSSRLQVAYRGDRLASDCERVLAASLMACTFLDYRATSYPFPKRPSSYVNYYCLRRPTDA